MYKKFFGIVIFCSYLLFTISPALALQSTSAVYVVQDGDNLYSIATRFNVDVTRLMNANGITDGNQLFVGQKLIIPGIEGVSGVLDTSNVGFGDTYRNMIRRTQLPEPVFRKLNRIISPTEFYVGANLIIPTEQTNNSLNIQLSPTKGTSLLELAVKANTTTWALKDINRLQGTWDGLPGDLIYAKGGEPTQKNGNFPPAIIRAEIRNLPIKQGGTGLIKVVTQPGVSLNGILVDHPLHFFTTEDGSQVAIQGVYSLLEPGIYPLRLDATLPDGSIQSFEQNILIAPGNYGKQDIYVDPSFLDPAVTEPELQNLVQLTSNITQQKYWQGIFQIPVSLPYCYKDWFGTRRSYNESDYSYFHSGLDFGICSEVKPFDIYTPANGVVVFAGPLIVRGNATVIDHGWGIYSGYWHQEEIYVSTGQQVTTGELIGKIGGTGRVTGPHLHWEIWANGVQVDPQDWLDQAFP